MEFLDRGAGQLLVVTLFQVKSLLESNPDLLLLGCFRVKCLTQAKEGNQLTGNIIAVWGGSSLK